MRAPPARVMAALKAAYSLDVREAWQAWRNLKQHLDRAVGLVDLTRHPRITAAEVRAARMELVKQADREISDFVLHEEQRARGERGAPPAIRDEDFYPDYDESDLVEYEFSADTKGDT